MILIKILICLLFIIILLQIYDWIKSAMGIKEGMDQVGPPPTTPVPQPLSNTGLSNDPLYLSTINASNIKMLSDQITKRDIDTINNEISSLQTQVKANNAAMTALGKQLSNVSSQVVGASFKSASQIPAATGTN